MPSSRLEVVVDEVKFTDKVEAHHYLPGGWVVGGVVVGGWVD